MCDFVVESAGLDHEVSVAVTYEDLVALRNSEESSPGEHPKLVEREYLAGAEIIGYEARRYRHVTAGDSVSHAA